MDNHLDHYRSTALQKQAKSAGEGSSEPDHRDEAALRLRFRGVPHNLHLLARRWALPICHSTSSGPKLRTRCGRKRKISGATWAWKKLPTVTRGGGSELSINRRTRRATNSGGGAALKLRSTVCQVRFTRSIARCVRHRIIETGIDIGGLQIHQPDVVRFSAPVASTWCRWRARLSPHCKPPCMAPADATRVS